MNECIHERTNECTSRFTLSRFPNSHPCQPRKSMTSRNIVCISPHLSIPPFHPRAVWVSKQKKGNLSSQRLFIESEEREATKWSYMCKPREVFFVRAVSAEVET